MDRKIYSKDLKNNLNYDFTSKKKYGFSMKGLDKVQF